MTPKTETQNTEIDTAYFDDIEDHIEMLQTELSVTEDDSPHAEDLIARIEYLHLAESVGDKWVDNDATASPDAWKTLATYTEEEAISKQCEWEGVLSDEDLMKQIEEGKTDNARDFEELAKELGV